MSLSELKFNRLERFIFGFALVIGAILVLIRVGIFIALWLSHHSA